MGGDCSVCESKVRLYPHTGDSSNPSSHIEDDSSGTVNLRACNQ